ncbi:MAG: hypothetical protein HZA02_03080 [Nitrospinae bacterium]|nr:hypothetical protein [Nitrospinota bacterium]
MESALQDIYSNFKDSLVQSGLFSPAQNGAGANTWRISPEPFYLSEEEVRFFSDLGSRLLKFYEALNRMYLDSAKGRAPGWIAEYLDIGKPSDLVDYARMNRFKGQLPGILRPDAIVTESGYAITELDSVPGGFGLLACLQDLYRAPGRKIVGADEGGVVELFRRMMSAGQAPGGDAAMTLRDRRNAVPASASAGGGIGSNGTLACPANGTLGSASAIVVSDESADYLSEMKYLQSVLRERGFPLFVAHPRDLLFREEGIYLRDGGGETRIDAIYRFLELFDLKNIPKAELLMYGNKKGTVRVTPPFKHYLEEKLGLALLHHPALAALWEKALGPETFAVLSHLIPKTWVLDNRELPPYGVIPGLTVGNKGISDWRELYPLTQKEREFAIKTSGFSPRAWGSRGVTIGHDVSSEDWRRTLEESLRSFDTSPCILQTFRKGRRVKVSYYRPQTRQLVEMESRARLTPYYFVVEGRARLGGIMATLCPRDKKKIHGMADAIIVPCACKNV